jgi:hypothetical protein
MSDSVTKPFSDDAARFEAALTRLETALAASVKKVADMARRTGFEDGIAHAAAQLEDVAVVGPDLTPILREELGAAKAREAALHEAVVTARAALDEAMDDIRNALGPL